MDLGARVYTGVRALRATEPRRGAFLSGLVRGRSRAIEQERVKLSKYSYDSLSPDLLCSISATPTTPF